MKLTKNFSLIEFTRSATAAKHGVLNQPGKKEIRNLKKICVNVLEPLRSLIGDKVIDPTSGFRSKHLNHLLKGSKTSQHLTGEAVDFVVPGMDLEKVFQILIENLPYDQAIFEVKKKGRTTKKWIHVSYRNRHKPMRAKFNTRKNKMEYLPYER